MNLFEHEMIKINHGSEEAIAVHGKYKDHELYIGAKLKDRSKEAARHYLARRLLRERNKILNNEE